MAERYVTYPEFDTYVRSETTYDESLKHDALDAAVVAVDNALGRKLAVATTATARVFRPVGTDVLWLDDFTTLTSLVEDGTTLTSGTDFVLYPLNGLSAAGEAVPYDRALRYRRCWFSDGPLATVTVTAAWGWATIPPQIKQMCLITAKALLETREFSQGIVALAETGAFGARDTKAVRDTISAYRSHKMVGLA